MSTTVRILLIGVFCVFGVILIGSGHEWIAVLSFGLAIYFFGIDAYLPIVQLLASLLVCSVLTIVFWLPTSSSGIGLFDYLQSHWYMPAFWFAVCLWGIWRNLSEADETWQILRSGYSVQVERPTFASKYAATGFLGYEEEAFPVTTLLLTSGLLLAKPNRSTAHLPWERIHQIRAEGQHAIVALKRQSMVPFEITVPWNLQFDEHVPPGLLI